MSSNPNHTIGLHNYEEFFVLYVDDELTAAQKETVDAFVAQHPHLREELDLLLGTKLPAEDVSYAGKKELFSAAMKLNAVDEDLLLYLDNELTAAERKAVEERIAADGDYALLHSLLLRTRLDPAEKILHPAKKELYRHASRVVVFKVWMRMAAAVVVLLSGSLFFLLDKNNAGGEGAATAANTPAATDRHRPAVKTRPSLPVLQTTTEPAGQTAAALPQKTKKAAQKAENVAGPAKENAQALAATGTEDFAAGRTREVVKFDVARFTGVSAPESFKNPLTAHAVTIELPQTYNPTEDPGETAGSDGDFKNTKKTPAKGFFRKVSRFIERNTGIGTVNADNELLIGAVALKLK